MIGDTGEHDDIGAAQTRRDRIASIGIRECYFAGQHGLDRHRSGGNMQQLQIEAVLLKNPSSYATQLPLRLLAGDVQLKRVFNCAGA